MSNDNLDLFDDGHEALGQFIDNIDNIPADELYKHWRQMLANLVDLFYAELQRQGESREKSLNQASKLVAVLAHYYGGRSCYLPTGERLTIALRDNELFHAYVTSNGDISALAKKYDLTDSRVYLILREQQKLHLARYQLPLFSEK